MSSIGTAPPARRGRPRDPRVDDAIRAATTELLVEGGYAALTMEGVARRAGVGPASIYRRWPSKAHLVHELVFPDEQRLVVAPGTPLAEVVRALAHGVVASFGRPEALAAIPGLMAEYARDPELRGRLQDRFEPDAKATLRRALGTAAVDVDLLLDAVLGTIVVALFVTGRRATGALADDVADLLLEGVH